MDDYLRERELQQNQVDIYGNTSTITDVPFPTETFADQIFGRL